MFVAQSFFEKFSWESPLKSEKIIKNQTYEDIYIFRIYKWLLNKQIFTTVKFWYKPGSFF